MRVLLDTHTLLWFVEDDPRLPVDVGTLIENNKNEKYVSVASLWEMAIKVSLGKLKLTRPFEDFLSSELVGFNLLPISVSHLLRVARLPLHHRDPFDRMLAAQSQAEALPVVSGDTQFDAYRIQRIW